MKNLNVKKIMAMFTTSLVLINMSGCKKNEEQLLFSETSIIQDNEFDESEAIIVQNDVFYENDNTITSKVKEEEVIKYFEELEEEIDNYINEKNFDRVKEKAKNIFITCIDFIFYDEEIKGVSFDSLTADAKNKIMYIAANIDKKIEAKIPGYKETIKDKFGQGYTYISEKLINALIYADSKLEEEYGDKYDDVKNKASDAKDNIVDSAINIYEEVTEEIDEGFMKIKDWYEGMRNGE